MVKNSDSRIFQDMEVSRELNTSIVARIVQARRRTALYRLLGLATLSALAAGALVPAVDYALQEFRSSGFYDYAALLFSDSSSVFVQWKPLMLSLAESLPSIAILMLFVLASTLLWSLRRVRVQAKVVFSPVVAAL